MQPKSWGTPCVFQPLDVAYVAAVLEKQQHTVQIIDAPTEGWRHLEQIEGPEFRVGLKKEEIMERIRQWSPKLVIITVPTSGWFKTAAEVASAAKSIDQNIATVMFGLHPSARPSECLNNPSIDFVVIGEPEQTILELAEVLEKGNLEELPNVLGIGFIKKGETIITGPRPLIKDLDTLPFPARHLLPMQEYFAAAKVNPLRGEIRKPWASITTSRGCVNRCVYCSVHIVMGRRWRSRSPENVVNEIEQLLRDYHVKQIDFEDGNMALNKKRLEAICDLIIERKLRFEWYAPNGIRADTLDENLLRKMQKSGCKRIMVAPESGVQRVVTDIIHKNLDLKKVENAIVLARKVGIKVGCFFVMGLIGETKKEIEESIHYAYKLKKHGADRFCFSIAQPIYGTELYEEALKGGFLKEQFGPDVLSGGEPLIETPEFTTEELCNLVMQASMINFDFKRDMLLKGLKNPGKAVRFLLKIKEKPKVKNA
jgi:magnesium-protoporphyrin IX monomethyl ester (oxidative) cyclase